MTECNCTCSLDQENPGVWLPAECTQVH